MLATHVLKAPARRGALRANAGLDVLVVRVVCAQRLEHMRERSLVQ